MYIVRLSLKGERGGEMGNSAYFGVGPLMRRTLNCMVFLREQGYGIEE